MAKADKALAARRVDEILQIRLDGAQWWDVREYVREKEQEQGSAWYVAPGGKLLSDAMIRKYQEKADKIVQQSHEKSRKKLLRRHLAWRRHLYGKAVNAGDYRAALAAARDEAELLGLYPARGVEVHGNVGGAIALQIVEEIVVRCPPPALEHVAAETNTHVNGSPHSPAGVPIAEARPASSGAASVPQE
jgi:hypothetical protein